MKLESIKFYSNDTHLGKFYKITIVVEIPDPDRKYNYSDYWCIAGYSLVHLIQSLIEKLNQLFGNVDFPDLEEKS